MPAVFITGASRGLGLEFASQYAKEGWHVIATCRNPAEANALKSIEGDVRIETLDVVDGKSVSALKSSLGNEAIDVLSNNAGIFGPRNPTLDPMDYDAWDEALRTNTMAPLRIIAAFAPNVARSGLKTIVTLSSILGSIAENSAGGDYIYRSSKAAVNAVMKSLSIDLAGEGIRVVLLHPGWVQTDMGGSEAAIAPPESVTGMRAVIAGLTESDSGRFFNYDGTEVPW